MQGMEPGMKIILSPIHAKMVKIETYRRSNLVILILL